MLGAATYRLVRDSVRVEALEPLDLKGKSAKVAAFRLLEAVPDGAAIASNLDSPFVGRALELHAFSGSNSPSASPSAPAVS